MYWNVVHFRRNVLECGSLVMEYIGMWFTCNGIYWNVVHLRRNIEMWFTCDGMYSNVVHLRRNALKCGSLVVECILMWFT